MKLAIVHDYLREYGGAERVVEVLHEIWPEAPLYTSFVDWISLGDQAYRFKNWDIRTSWVQHNPAVKKFISPLRFLAPKIWESFDLSDYDVVLSSSGWFMCRGVALNKSNIKYQISNLQSKNQINQKTQSAKLATSYRLPATSKPIHICYIHHPPRNLYGYATGSDWQKYKIVRAYAAVVNFYLRHYDFESAQKVDFFIANSKETARRVEKFYRRKSMVIYPPIEIQKPQGISHFVRDDSKDTKSYFLSVGRLVWSKRVDLVIEACNKLKLPLKIVGIGKEEAHLKSLAGSTVEFQRSVSDSQLSELYANAKALIFCAQDEDFGMVPVEAMAHGTPVIALGQGGVLETVVDNKTGIIFTKPEVESLMRAINKFNNSYNGYKYYKECIKRAEKFGKERFKREIIAFINSKI